MNEADIDAVSFIRVRGWQSAYAGIIPQAILDEMSVEDDAQRRRAWFASSRGRAVDLVAVDERGTPVGWICFGPYRGDTDAQAPGEIYALYVSPGLVGQGIGQTLLGAAHRHAAAQEFATMRLWVLRDNSRARKFYTAAGYVPDGAVQMDMYGETAVPELRYRRDLAG